MIYLATYNRKSEMLLFQVEKFALHRREGKVGTRKGYRAG